MICCCEAAKQMEKVDKLVDAYKAIARVFVDRPFDEYVTATNESRGAMLKQVCKSVLDGEIDTEVLLCFAAQIMDATEEVYQGSESEDDSDYTLHELDSVLLDIEDEFEQFTEDFDRYVKAAGQAYKCYLKSEISREDINAVYRRVRKRITDAYESGLISESGRNKCLTDVLAAIEEDSE